MKKVIDLTDNFFDLLKYDKSFWEEHWTKTLFFMNPTIYGRYFSENKIDADNQRNFINKLNRIDLDRLYMFWEKYKNDIKKNCFQIAGDLYERGLKNFGIFIAVGFDVKEITVISTSKGKAFIIDLWFVRRAYDGEEYSKIRKMDEFATLLS